MRVPAAIQRGEMTQAIEEDQSEPATATSARGVTLRAVLIGMILMVADAFWITVVEVRWYTLDGTSLPLFITPVFFLFCLALLNLGTWRLFPRAARYAFS